MKIKPLFCLFLLGLTIVVFGFIFNSKITSQNWQFAIKNQVGAQSILNIGKNLSFDANNLYFSDGKGLIYALNKNSGQVEWLKQLGNHSPFQITQDQKSIYISSFDSHVYSLDKKNGYVNWSFTIPNQFWPDTEVILDENDPYVFFADRSGLLYALNKNNGEKVWEKKFESIDNTKSFVDKAIHFGFIKQNDNQLIIDNFPSKTIFVIDKLSGEIIKETVSNLNIDLKEETLFFNFEKFDVVIEQNIIDQPIINCFDKNHNLLWSYRTENRIKKKEIYQDNNRLYYLNGDNTILESIKISEKPPDSQTIKKINFTFNENFSVHYPYKNTNPQINTEDKKTNLYQLLKNKTNQIRYFIENIKQLFIFNISTEEKDGFFELSINHQQNFYKNVFKNVRIETIFTNKSGQVIKVGGFYYDQNLWKIRAKLSNGEWLFETRIKTPFIIKKQKGKIDITESSSSILEIKKDVFVTNNNEVFLPIGIQDILVDQNKNGASLDQLGFAKNIAAPSIQSEYNYLSFSEYLDLYQSETKVNIYRYGPDNWAPTIWRNLENNNNFEMDVTGNLTADDVFTELKKRNLKIMMSVFAFYPPYTSRESISRKNNQEVIKKYLDYVVARYSSYVDIWELTNEAMPSLEWQNFVSDYISKIDPYGHPITTNLENTQLNNSNLLSIHIYKEKINDNNEIVKTVNSLQKPDWQNASIVSEFGFKGLNYFNGSADMMRKLTWAILFRKNGIIFWNTADKLFENEQNANIYLGPQERNYLNSLQSFLPKLYFPLENDFQIINENQLAIYKLEDQSHCLYYLLNLNQANNTQYKLPLKISKKGTLEFINPRNNTLISKIEVNENTFDIKLPYFQDDLAIKITY